MKKTCRHFSGQEKVVVIGRFLIESAMVLNCQMARSG